MTNPAVIVMARAPRLGEGKTRLRPALSDEACLRLQQAFLNDAVQVALEADLGPVYLAVTPASAAGWATAEFAGRAIIVPQEGNGLGERMLAALQRVESAGHAPLVMIGTDAPLLQPSHLRAAVRELDTLDLCLGPSADGGYYLLACRTPQPRLFEGVDWGTSAVLASTLRHAKAAGLRVSLLDTLYDVDTPEDLQRLRTALKSPGFATRGWTPEHTLAMLGPQSRPRATANALS
ncbi:MAG: TIGR04282 family arsenosugar biosynthesis glycosyltransferase [Chloroflexi bacterium]|nr:TIGR04282 family arsenosugar biosynthesis glycosyltransferase [Chloroflexota bacterium]